MVTATVVAAKRVHLCEGELLRFLRGELSRAECCRVVRHLLTSCPECQATARSLWAFGDQPLIPLGWLRAGSPGNLFFGRRRWGRGDKP